MTITLTGTALCLRKRAKDKAFVTVFVLCMPAREGREGWLRCITKQHLSDRGTREKKKDAGMLFWCEKAIPVRRPLHRVFRMLLAR